MRRHNSLIIGQKGKNWNYYANQKKIGIINLKCDAFKCIQLGISIKAIFDLSFTGLCLVLFLHRIKKKTTRVSLTMSSQVNKTSNIRSSYSTLVRPLYIDPQRVSSVLKAFGGVLVLDTGPEEKLHSLIQLSWKVVNMRRASSCMTSEKTTKKSMGLRNNSMVVLWVGHLSVGQTKRDSWFLGAQSHKKYSNYLRNEFPILKNGGGRRCFFKILEDTRATIWRRKKI